MTQSNPVRITRIVLADDHDLLRQGLTLLLQAQADMRVVGEARNGLEAIKLVQEQWPDIVVMDISMAQLDGLEACERIRALAPGTQVLMLTMHESEEYFLQSLKKGAAGYIVKKAAPTELCNAVRTIAQGGAFLYPGLAKALIRAYVAPQNPPEQPGSLPPQRAKLDKALQTLTGREMEVLKLVAEGSTNQEIADKLVISIKTVQAHRSNMMEKLGLHDITQLVRFALHYGLISPQI
ncbi:DNA-binding response regulator [Ktedonobacter sp. SOSP1-52]|uniref:response regulator n=1 Tax=Ktedonobacter sp. SOSP1-52 TaxID=2778366 RepID=UPI0019161599|nr:response regulator transcription factor [Ktedonobacter sp. SOSP1-52]GHO67658.1 DNA-binding response regulator [Ktedonobacter sp. SOSP1-52]